jgi:demethylmenaquinone methyltransferase/2-methoxy-6-polyprenyl-1,4-benzoquinol methylase
MRKCLKMRIVETKDKDYYLYIKRFFERCAAVYDIAEIFTSKVRTKVADLVNAREDSKILDVCTGTGRQAFAFAKKGSDVTGIDLSEAMLRVANRNNNYENMKFEYADAANMPFIDNCFDISSVSFGLHDMPLSIREKVLEEMVRVTKPKGTIVIVDYALPRNKIGKFLIYHFVKFYESKYYSKFIKSDLETLLKESGIDIQAELPILLGAARILKGIKNFV